LSVFAQKIEKLLSYLSRFKPKRFRVVVMPDFFLDRLISWNGNIRRFSRNILAVANRKGGNIDNVAQMDLKGGNAVNTAAALTVLGTNVFPIIYTSKFGLNLLKLYFQSLNVDLSYVKVNGAASITTALEFEYQGEKRNVMLRDLGSLREFGPNDLSKRDFTLLEKTEYVCVFNWAGTRRYGTELAQTVFGHVKARGRGITYFDTADPLSNRPDVPRLVKKVLLRHKLIDVLSLNENEAITYAKYVIPKQMAKLQNKHKFLPTLAKECGKILSQKFTSRIDLHTTTYSATFTKNKNTIVPAFNVKALRATGAGDAWNAGNIYADANDFQTDIRLTFANAVAAYYISSPNGEHPRIPQLHEFLQKILHKCHR